MKFLSTFRGSFYSPTVYQQARYASVGWGMWYAFVLVALTTLIGTVWLMFMLHQWIMQPRDGGRPPLLDSVATQIVDQLPELTLTQGKLTVLQGEQPHTIFIHERVGTYEFNEPFITIDTTGNTTSDTMKTPILVTQTDIISEKDKNQKEIRSLSELTPDKTRVYNKADAQRNMRDGLGILHRNIWKIYLITAPIMWGIFTVAFFISRAIMLLMLGVVAYVTGAATVRMDYMSAVRLASVAYTPVAVFNALAFTIVYDTAGTLTLFALGALLTVGAVVLTNPPKATA